jgi:hypothetical protein
MAAKATFALKTAVWLRRGRLVMVSPEYAAILAAVRQKIHLSQCPDSLRQLFDMQGTPMAILRLGINPTSG